VVGDAPLDIACAQRLASGGIAEVVLSAQTRSSAQQAAEASGGAFRSTVLLDGAAPTDALILLEPGPALTRDVALWAARTCPYTTLILAAREGLALCHEAARASGLPPWLILCTGGIPRAFAESAELARLAGASVTQVCVPVIGGDPPSGLAVLTRYATVAGIPARDLGLPLEPPWPAKPAERVPDGALVVAAVQLTRAVILDRRQVLCCGGWVQDSLGISGGFVIAPLRVGVRGAEEPLHLKLTLEERSLLQRAAAADRGSCWS